MNFYQKKLCFYLVGKKKCCTFAPAFRKEGRSRRRGWKKVWKFLLENFADWKKRLIFAVPFREKRREQKSEIFDRLETTNNQNKEGTKERMWRTYKKSPSHSKEQKKKKIYLQRRVWSWLRMNASDRPNTCKSRGSGSKACFACRRPAHGWVTRMQPACNRGITRRNPA